MDTQKKDMPPGDSLLVSEFGTDGNDELLLLRMLEGNNDPSSPALRKVMDDGPNVDWITRQKNTPFRMERPQSSGIDMSSFTFARPAQHGKPFSLQLSTSQSSSTTVHQEDASKSDQGFTNILEAIEQNGLNRESRSTRPRNTEAGTAHDMDTAKYVLENQTLRAVPPEEGVIRNEPGTDSTILDCQTELPLQAGPLPELSTQYFTPECDNSVPQIQQGRSTNPCDEGSTEKENPNPCLASFSKNGEEVTGRVHTAERSAQADDELPDSCLLKGQSRPAKRRHSDRKKDEKKILRTSIDPRDTNLPEKVLFEQLIHRIKTREESEAAASDLKREMEANISSLTEENTALKNRLDLFSSKLRQKTSQVEEYRFQTDNWKKKVSRIKMFLNEFGADYQNLRGEAIHLKATRRSLENERREIKDSIAGLTLHLSELSRTSDDRQGLVTQSENRIRVLSQNLAYAEERSKYVQAQLAEEKKRSSLLESYILNCSHSQDVKLGRVRSDQLEIMKQLGAVVQTLSQHTEASRTEAYGAFGSKLEGCITLFRSLDEKLSGDKVELQLWKETVSESATRMNDIVHRYAADIENNFKRTEALTRGLEEHLQSVGQNVGKESTLLMQLSESQKQCSGLKKILEASATGFERLSSSVLLIEEKEVNLSQQITNLGARLSEAKLPERFKDTYVHISEKLALEYRMQELSSRLNLAEDSVKTQKLDNKEMSITLLEMTTKIQEANFQSKKFESEAISWQETAREIEIKSQEELTKAVSACQVRCQAGFEQQLHDTLENKDKVEQENRKAREQLVEVQRILAETTSSADKKCDEFESLLKDKELQIQQYEATLAENTSIRARQEVEIERLKQLETNKTDQLTSLKSQADAAKSKADTLEIESTKIVAENERSLHELLETLSTVKRDLLKKEEEYQIIQRELIEAKSTISSLEFDKSKSRIEAEGLLRRVKDSEQWVERAEKLVHKTGISAPQEKFSDAWSKLEMVVQSRIINNSTRTTLGKIRPKTPEASTPHTGCGIQEEDTHRVESTSRTQSIQDGSCPSSHQDISRNRDSDENKEYSALKPLSNIVPFSSVRRGLSATPCPNIEKEDFEFTAMLILTPDKRTPILDPAGLCKNDTSVPSQPSKSINNGAQRVSESKQLIHESTDQAQKASGPPTSKSKGSVTRHKVSFGARVPAAKIEEDQPFNKNPKDDEFNILERPLIENKSTRANRHTYSKRKNDLSARSQGRVSSQNNLSYGEDPKVDNEVWCSDKNKKAKLSEKSPCPGSQRRISSDYFDRKISPAKLASGSSRTPTSTRALSNPTCPTKRTRTTERRAQGDKYNARFTQGAPT